jgi:hypothetical protein
MPSRWINRVARAFSGPPRLIALANTARTLAACQFFPWTGSRFAISEAFQNEVTLRATTLLHLRNKRSISA